jgi:hydrogenase maturation protein HypF
MKLERYRVEVNGIVQGVGFRPFVFKLAQGLSLKGAVLNTSGGVLIEAEGKHEELEAFVSRLVSDAPPLAAIDTISVKKLEPAGYEEFTISSSIPGIRLNTLISPDINTCGDCRSELFDPADHRHLYPFINCTNCGPRYTIICDVPYDRGNTTMRDFVMCPVCGAQYREPADRRYHAQPLCCHDCGPELILTDREGKVIEGGITSSGSISNEKAGAGVITSGNANAGTSVAGHTAAVNIEASSSPINRAAELLSSGSIIALKSLGGYHLVCNALDGNAVDELRRRKFRDEKPFALMARDLDTIHKYCDTDEISIQLLQSAAAPIVLLPKKPASILPEQLAPGNPDLGIMLPYTPVHLLLFSNETGKKVKCPEILVMTSGNKSDEPICYKDEDAFSRLKGIADYFLTNNRPIGTRTDDSVIRNFRGREYFIRRSRGYVPAPIAIDRAVLPADPPSVLALGGELKNTFCMTKGNRFFVSQHIGDLENLETLQSFEEGIEHYKRLFDIKPTIAAFDMHPAYLSTAYAQALKDIAMVPVQHHHAHVAACMAENSLGGEVIGVAFDGTGYGEDGNIWGGEFFTGSYLHFQRAAHLQYFRLPGSDAAVREPWRVAASCLHQFGYELDLPGDITPEKLKLVAGMLEKGLNSPLTSSMGRLFDAVSALIGIKAVNRFEGQAAIELEHAALGKLGSAYCYDVEDNGDHFIIGIKGIIEGILEDIASGVLPGAISGRFHGTVVKMVEEACCRIKRKNGLDRVVLSGGVFQNMLLLSECMDRLEFQGFKVYIHRRAPANDGGISLGQAVIAMARQSNF